MHVASGFPVLHEGMTTLADDLTDPRSSVRLRAVMAAGTEARVEDLEVLVDHCAVEPDLQVREALTWALVRLPAETVVPRLLHELHRPEAQARSQALHTLSKIRDGSVYPEVAERLGTTTPVCVGRPGAQPSCSLRPTRDPPSPDDWHASSARATGRPDSR